MLVIHNINTHRFHVMSWIHMKGMMINNENDDLEFVRMFLSFCCFMRWVDCLFLFIVMTWIKIVVAEGFLQGFLIRNQIFFTEVYKLWIRKPHSLFTEIWGKGTSKTLQIIWEICYAKFLMLKPAGGNGP